MDDDRGGKTASRRELGEKRSDEQAKRSVLISNIPRRDQLYQALYLHFQKECNGEGKVEKLVMLDDGKAILTYEKAKVAERVLQKKQIFSGRMLNVEPFNDSKLLKGKKQYPQDAFAQLLPVLEHKLENGVTVTVYQGDITQQKVDIIVNAANECLDHGAGVAGAIVKNGGYQIQQESRQIVQQYGRVPVGQVVQTGPGRLFCKRIFHAVGPRWSDHGPQGSRKLMFNACFQSFRLASQFGFKSIALPAISSGIFGVPKEVCAEVLFSAAEMFCCETTSHNQLRDIRFVNIDSSTNDAFRREFYRRYVLTNNKEHVTGKARGNEPATVHSSFDGRKVILGKR